MFGNKVRHVLHKVHKRWLVVGITALALGLTTTLTTVKAADTVSINYVSGYSVAVWQRANGVQATSKKLPTGTRWASYGAVQQGDNGFYLNVGGDQWIDSNYADLAGENSSQELRGVVTIQYVPGYGIAVWNSASGDRQIVRRAVLRHGTQWQVYRRAVVNGRTWYNLGGNQWIDGGFAKLTAQQYRGPKTYQSGGPTVIKPTEPTKPAPSTPIVQKVSYRVVTRDQYGTIVSTRIYDGNIGDTITIGAAGIDGYTLNDGSTKTIRLSADSGQNDIDFTYTRNTPSNPNQGSYVPPAVTQQYVNYRILAVDDQGQPIQGYIPTTGSSLPRAAINAPTIPGYTVSGARTINVGVNGGDVKFIYTKDTVKDVSYTIKAVDDQGVAIASFTSDTKSGQPGATISAPSITGYTVTGASTAPIPIAGGPITFKYTKNTPTTPATVTYQIKAVDEQEQPITAYTSQDTSGKPGDSITAPTIPGYTIQGSSTAQIPATGGPITFKYTKNAPAPVSYTIKIVDEQGNPITGYPDQTGQGAPGTPIPVPPVTGYTIKTPTTATVPAAGGVVTFTYTQDAPAVTTVKYTIAYVDEDKQPITTTNPASGEGKVGDPISALPIPGYTAPTETQTLKSDTTAVTFVYKKDAVTPATVNYTIAYVDKDGNTITTNKPTSGSGQVGDPISAPDIDGYTATAETAKQTLAADTTKITYTYTKNPAATVKYTIEYLDQANNQAITTSELTSGEGKVGDPVNAPNIAGYTATAETAKQTLAADTTKITYIYTKNPAATVKYTIEYLDQVNKQAITTSEPASGEGKAGDPVSAPNIDGYTVTAATAQQTLAADTVKITYIYMKNAPATVTYTINFVDQSNGKVQEPQTGVIGKVGDTIPAPTITGYTASTAAQTLKADTTELTFVYSKDAPATVNYTIQYLEGGNAITTTEPTSGEGKAGDPVTAPNIPGYTADPSSAKQTLQADTTNIKFTYTKNAVKYTIAYLDQDNKAITTSEPAIGEGKAGDSVTAPNIAGYTVTAATAKQTLAADTGTITFRYTQNAPATVTYTTSFVDQLGTKIKDSQTGVVGKVGDAVTAPNIDGYTADAATATQTLKADTTAIKFTYTKNAPATVTYTTSFVDQSGAKIQDSQTGVTGKVGDNITAPNIDGYTADAATATQTLQADTTAIKFIYTKNAPATITYAINFVDQSGTTIQDPQTGFTGKVGDEIPAPAITGYTAPTATQVLKADTKALTFTYTKKAVQTTVQFVDSTSGKAIADPVQVITKQTYPAQQILTGKDGNFYILLDGQKTAIDPATQPTLTLKYKLIAGTMNAVDEHGTVIKELTSGLTPLILRSDGYYWISYPAQFRIFDTAGNEYDLTDPNRGGSAGWVQTPLYDSTFPHTYTLSYKKVVGPITEFTDQEKQAMAQLRSSYNALAKPVLTNGLYTTMPTYKPFNAGSTTTAFQQQTIGIWNFFRAIWGLPAVTTDSAVSATDQVASSFMAGYMAGLQHTVDGYTQPSDMTDNDWIKVQNGLMSNLATVSGQNTQVDQLIMGFLADNHNLKGNDAGHRLNMLRPSLLTSGVGLGFSTNAAATGQKGQSNLSLDMLKGASSQATYSANNGVMFYPGAGVFPIELLPTDTIGGKIAYTPISAASYGGVDLRKVTKVTVADLTANQSADLTGIYNKDTNPGGQLIFGGSGNSDTYGDANTTITATGYTFVNQHAYRITFYGDGLSGGSISTTFKTFSFAG
ncbi:MucBP domain-containing protein [Schleiferilactobacillus harbinensis]|jgi:hypothetical protein|uniref:MucBP domain-containing protein n=1 Tax=Schleiferilactobacillus harbinensis TaxID=304207 RepID=UPI00243069E8|nr:MucBP domain-containing protein [Schleiferilactobacillus harbinensis]MCI1850992.1 MucBP domain-containing protein [Schleiferilactobacillus harbinensis]